MQGIGSLLPVEGNRMIKLSVAIPAFLAVIVPSLLLGGDRAEQKIPFDEVQITQAWLDRLKNEQTDVSVVLSFMSSEFNFDGRVLTKVNDIRQQLSKMRAALSSPSITTDSFQRLDRNQIAKYMTNSKDSRSKHSRKYQLSRDKINSMVLFHLTAVFPTGEKNIDGVFVGFDSNMKIVSWFD